MSDVSDALAIALEAHKGQKRKLSHAPYAVHVLDVVKFLLYADAQEYVVVAGALHDLLEDTRFPKERLRERFGADVLRLVEFCTEPENTPDSTDDDLLRSWRRRKEHAIEAAKNAADDELLLKLADSLSNLQSLRDDYFLMGEVVWEKFRGGKEGNRWYFSALGEVFEERLGGSRLQALFERTLHELF